VEMILSLKMFEEAKEEDGGFDTTDTIFVL